MEIKPDIDNIKTSVLIEYNNVEKCNMFCVKGVKANGEIQIFNHFNWDESIYPLRKNDGFDMLFTIASTIDCFIQGELQLLNNYKAEIKSLDSIPEMRMYQKLGGWKKCGLFINNEIFYEMPYEIRNVFELYEEAKKINNVLIIHYLN